MRRHATALLLPLLIALAYAAFQPALSGPFLLDDFLHLPKLAGNDGQIDTAEEVLQLVGVHASPSARPLSFLSLLIDDNAWPTKPRGFKTTNLLIHLLNAVLVFVLVRTLVPMIRTKRAPPDADWVAIAATAIWVLNPMQLSPTMMVIQRMTLLAGTFSLLALLAYLHGRRIALERPRTGWAWMILGFGSALGLGILSKEPAIMTICYVIALEATVLGPLHPPRPPRWNLWAAIFLILPLIAIAAYFFLHMQRMEELLLKRNFDFTERLLTEGRVLIDYLRVIFLPSIAAVGPYHDDYTVSRGLLAPPMTLIAWIVITSLIALALWRRRRWQVFSLAVLWFFLGHLLESTVLPIELYFEHRNYLPMLGPIFALCYGVLSVERPHLKLVAIGLGAYAMIVGGITYFAATAYGNPALIASHWAAEHPRSLRAQADAFNFWISIRERGLAQRQMDLALSHAPDNAGLYLLRLTTQECGNPSSPPLGASLSDLERVVPNAPFEHASIEGVKWLVDHRDDGRCRISVEDTLHIIDLYLTNPRFGMNGEAVWALNLLAAKLHMDRRDLDATIGALDRAYAGQPVYSIALNQAVLLATAGLLEPAAQYLDLAKGSPTVAPNEWLERTREIEAAEKTIDQLRHHFESSQRGAGNGHAER